jgi:glutamyl-Q tRNA(Asp) synthetase
MTVTTRFAPSPTGLLHLGHARAALFAHRRARAAGGRFLLRLEDIDPARCRAAFAAAILDDLRWLGLHWDGDVRVQSQHLGEYRAALDRLAALGVLYPCFCSRADILREVAASVGAPHAPDGSPVYPGTCRMLPADERRRRIDAGAPYALRLDMQAARHRTGPLAYHDTDRGTVACRPERFDDVVLARRDVPASYHLCVAHDDAAQGVTLVTRGDDLRDVTDIHRLLQALLGWPAPDYAFHPLLTDAGGQKLSKRDRAATLRALRIAGVPPHQVLARVEVA